jgi:hypothetical protein
MRGSTFGAIGEACDLGSCLRRGDANVVSALKIEPELSAGTEPMSKAQRSIPGNGSPASDDLSYAIGRQFELSRKFGRVHLQRGKLLGENFARVNRWSHYHGFSIIIGDFDVGGTSRRPRPLEADAPLHVDVHLRQRIAPNNNFAVLRKADIESPVC